MSLTTMNGDFCSAPMTILMQLPRAHSRTHTTRRLLATVTPAFEWPGCDLKGLEQPLSWRAFTLVEWTGLPVKGSMTQPGQPSLLLSKLTSCFVMNITLAQRAGALVTTSSQTTSRPVRLDDGALGLGSKLADSKLGRTPVVLGTHRLVAVWSGSVLAVIQKFGLRRRGGFEAKGKTDISRGKQHDEDHRLQNRPRQSTSPKLFLPN